MRLSAASSCGDLVETFVPNASAIFETVLALLRTLPQSCIAERSFTALRAKSGSLLLRASLAVLSALALVGMDMLHSRSASAQTFPTCHPESRIDHISH
jgi:hypothetical protein